MRQAGTGDGIPKIREREDGYVVFPSGGLGWLQIGWSLLDAVQEY